jgi:hypothetical protein
MESRESAVQDALELSWELYSKYTSEIHEIILDSVGMPRDNTVEMLKIHGKPEGFFQTDTFCRDIANGWFFKYTEGEITKEQLIHNVVNWKTIYDSYEE